MGYNLVFFKEEDYLLAKCELTKEVPIFQEFFQDNIFKSLLKKYKLYL